MPTPGPLSGRTVAITGAARGIGLATATAGAAAGLAAGAATDGLLAAAGAERIAGLQVGVAAAPMLALLLSPTVRRALPGVGTMLLVVGAAWTLAPLIDEHVTRAVVVDGALPDLLHHLAGWPALIAGARLVHQPKPELTS